MIFCLETVSSATDRPLLIDTVNARAIRAALAHGVPNRLIINGFSLEPAKIETILPLAVEYDTAIVGYLLDERSQVPAGPDAKLSVALEIYTRALSAGLRPEQLIIDPVVAPLSWQDAAEHNRSLLEVLARLPDMLGIDVQTIASLSNLTTGAASRDAKQAMEQAFIPMLAAHGLSMLLVNMDHGRSVAMAQRCQWLLAPGVFSWGQLEGGYQE
jgi:5-methyltetrahydrofolate corrinoid/iron sulfur protein methyltransferase